MRDTTSVSQLASERRPARALAMILLNWGVIFAAFFAVTRHPSWPSLLAGFLLIGIEQHALGLWMHEGAHWLITRDRVANDFILTVLLSGPLFVPLRAFRERHFVHHRYLGTRYDTKPVIFTRVDGRHFWHFLLRTCLGLQFFSIAKGYLVADAPIRNLAPVHARRWILDGSVVAAVQGILFLLLCQVTAWPFYLWLWALPCFTISRFLAGLRSVIEHRPLPSERHPFTRTLQPTLLDRFLFCRVGFQYHSAHHRYPTIPYFNLPVVNSRTEGHAASHPGYLEVLAMLVRAAPEAPCKDL